MDEMSTPAAPADARAWGTSACPQPPADDHEHCEWHGCVEYVCCERTRWYLSAVSPIGEHWRNVAYHTEQERSRVATNMRIAGWTRVTLH